MTIESEYNDAILKIADLDLELTFDYSFISDPPILADIGSATIDFKNVSLYANWTSFVQQEDPESHPFILQFNDFNIYADKVAEPFTFEGINDLSLVISDLFSTLGNMIRGRLVSMSDSQLFTLKAQNVANKILNIIPGEIDVKDTDFYLYLSIAEAIRFGQATDS